MQTLAANRRAFYLFLSSAFANPPSAFSLSVLRSEEFLNAASRLFGTKPLLQLVRYAAQKTTSPKLHKELRQTFTNLFKVPGPNYVAPYESVFRDAREVNGQLVRGLLLGPSAIDARRWYRLVAVDVSDAFKDLPDHIALELNFLAHLCGKEEEFTAKDDQACLTRAWELERDFLTVHVLPWVGALRDEIHEKCAHPYFRAIADITVEFTRRDLATLESLVGPAVRKPWSSCGMAAG